MAQEFAGLGGDDSDVEAVDEGDDDGVFVGSADADFVEVAFVADGDFAAGVDAVEADAGLVAGGAVSAGFLGAVGMRWRGCFG